MTIPARMRNSIVVASTLCLTAVAWSQPADSNGSRASSSTSFSINPWFEYQFSADVDGGGEFDVARTGASVDIRMHLQRDLRLTLRFGYELDRYEFDGNTQLGADVWQDIHTFNFGAIFSMDMANDWSLFGGPVFQVSGEADAEFSDSWIAGGFVGVSYQVHDGLVIGGGVGVVDQIEDKYRIFPIVVLDWELTPELRLSSQTAGSAAGRTGFELIYDLGDGWEVAAGVAYEFRRFRLDDDGVAPEGIGTETGVPIWFRATYDLSPTSTLSAHVGWVSEADLEVEDRDGSRLAIRDYDPAPIIGLSASFRF